MSKNHKPGALDEFLERQDLAQNPANLMGGNFHSTAPISLGKDPVFRLVISILFAIVAAALLFFMLAVQKDNWIILIFVALFAVLSVLNIVDGIRNLPARRKRHKAHARRINRESGRGLK